MSWWDSGPLATIGDDPADVVGAALRKLVAKQGRPSGGELIGGLAHAIRSVGAELLQDGERQLLWIRVPRGAERFELGDVRDEPVGPIGEAFAGALRAIGDAYRRAFRRRPTWQEVIATLDFVVGAAPRTYLTDPRDWQFGAAAFGWQDPRGALEPAQTVDALAAALRITWSEMFAETIGLTSVALHLGSGAVLRPRAERADRAIVAELKALVLMYLKHAKSKRGAETLEPDVFASALGRLINERRERYLGGADGPDCAIELEVADRRRRVTHAKFGDGLVLRELRDTGDVKLEIAFEGGVRVLLERMLTAIPLAPTPAIAIPTELPLAEYRAPTVVARGPYLPTDLATDGVDIYWVDVDNDAIAKVSVGGGPVTILASEGGPSEIVVDATHVYWSGATAIRRIAKAGGDAVDVAPLGDHAVDAMAHDDQRVYWVDRTSGSVLAAPCTGGAAVVLAADQAEVAAIAVDATAIYWTRSSGQVTRLDKRDGALAVLATGPRNADALIVDATCVYWTCGEQIWKVDKHGGTAEVLAAGLDPCWNLADAGAELCWTASGAGTVIKIAKTGGDATVVVGSLDKPESLVVIGDVVCWADRGNLEDGMVLKSRIR